ncbi:Hypothetical predicted protein [Marmota monax]|uniref:Uncharacterized protein n=1 Tax=Marmota monax TaxID=9995 RepID=A0A5E4B0K3_MARMO|nr:hypothetical protein GHT09_019717 [Marmota monax]VTJ62299.1 Hypothetical predicted protein [Marmota monax]
MASRGGRLWSGSPRSGNTVSGGHGVAATSTLAVKCKRKQVKASVSCRASFIRQQKQRFALVENRGKILNGSTGFLVEQMQSDCRNCGAQIFSLCNAVEQLQQVEISQVSKLENIHTSLRGE